MIVGAACGTFGLAGHRTFGQVLGIKNAVNVVKATFTAIAKLRTRAEILAKRDINAL